MAWFQRGSGKRYRVGSIALILAVLAGCAAPPRPPDPPSASRHDAGSTTDHGRTFVAGDASILVFDNAIEYFRDLLNERGAANNKLCCCRRGGSGPPSEELSALPTPESAP